MSIIRIEKTKDYTIMSNYHFREKDMSLKAKGLLSLMLSLPENWDYSIAGLVAICKENETSIKTALDELKEFGYLEVVKKMPNETKTGRIEYEYIVYEHKINKINTDNIEVKVGKELIQELEKQGIENLGVEFLGVENPIQYNNKQLNTNNKILNSNKSKKVKFDEIINSFTEDEEIRELLGEWLKVRKAKRAAMTNRAIELNLQKLDKLANDSKMSVADYLKEVICRGWQAFYVINNYNKPKEKSMWEKMNEVFDE